MYLLKIGKVKTPANRRTKKLVVAAIACILLLSVAVYVYKNLWNQKEMIPTKTHPPVNVSSSPGNAANITPSVQPGVVYYEIEEKQPGNDSTIISPNNKNVRDTIVQKEKKINVTDSVKIQVPKVVEKIDKDSTLISDNK